MPHPSLNLRWIASFSSSCLHAADASVRGRILTDPRLAQVIAEPALDLGQAIGRLPIPARRFWRQLLALAHQVENNRQLATVALQKTIGRNAHLEYLSGELGTRIGHLENVVLHAIPGIVDELSVRSGPLRDLWEARGPGLLRGIGNRTDPRLLVETAEIVLVLPAVGGGGEAHLSNNSLRIEAVLTNAIPQLPEVLRLGWLLAQLQLDLPIFSEGIPVDRLPVVAALALIPPVLQGGQEVELGESSPQTLATAVAAWVPEIGANEVVVENLLVWWQTFEETRPDWRTALRALDQMLPAELTADAPPGP